MSNLNAIEELVRNRKVRTASDKIRKLLRQPSSKGDFKLLLQACDWYRRLGLFREAFLLVSDALIDPLPADKDFSTRSSKGRKILWAARLLNLLGASSQALRLARKLSAHDADSHQILGNILLTNFEYSEAYSHFTLMVELDSEPGSYLSGINRLSLADSLAGLNRYEEALAVARSIAESQRAASERFLQGIALEAWGEYLARAGRLREALPLLERARTYFPKDEQTPDGAILDKWEGYVRFRLAEKEEGQAILRRAVASLRQLALRPEAWLDVYRLMDDLGLLSSGESQRLAHYPGLPLEFKKMLKPEAVRVGSNSATLLLDLDTDEYVENGQCCLGLSQELKLLGALRLVDDWGLSIERAKAVVWPEEIHAYPLLEARLHKLIARLRTRYAIEIQVRDRAIFLSTAASQRVAIVIGVPGNRPSFLRDRTEFSAKEFSLYYGLSRSQAAIHLRKWRECGWLAVVGTGMLLKYHQR